MAELKLALLSVFDKEGIVELGEKLVKGGYFILSSGGTYKALKAGLNSDSNILEIADYTGYPEAPGGLVKTLQGKVHSGFLLDHKNPEHLKYMLKIGAHPIDFVAVNLYPFEKKIAEAGCTFEDAIENIDIGGPAMLRSAAKGMMRNGRPFVVVNREKYDKALHMMTMYNTTSIGLEGTLELRKELAIDVFEHTAKYDAAIKAYFDATIKAYQAKK